MVLKLLRKAMSNYEDTNGELIQAEQLNTFTVVEEFCSICASMTPHHIDESENKENFSEKDDEDITIITPISTLECVYCREEEESRIDSI
jgi:hypothetical protein